MWILQRASWTSPSPCSPAKGGKVELDCVILWYALAKGMKYYTLVKNTCSRTRESFGL